MYGQNTNSDPEKATPIRYCLYARKSSEDDERQALSIESQVKEALELAKRDGLNVVEVRRESHSANDILPGVRLRPPSGVSSRPPSAFKS
jgi:hypothetical protein